MKAHVADRSKAAGAFDKAFAGDEFVVEAAGKFTAPDTGSTTAQAPPSYTSSLMSPHKDPIVAFKDQHDETPVQSYRPGMWLGSIVETGNDAEYVKQRKRLADAAYLANWDEVFRALEKGQILFNENWSNAARLSR